MSRHSQAAVSSLRLAALVALALGSNPAPTIAQSADLTAAVARMAKVGRASSPTFSPDGRRIAFVSDLTGVPQIWTVPVEGGWPTLVTADNDPVGGVAWSPAGDWLAYTLAPGGGMNTQVYVVRAGRIRTEAVDLWGQGDEPVLRLDSRRPSIGARREHEEPCGD